MKNVWTRAFELLTLRLLLRQLGLAIAAALLFLIWLRVPDASVIDVAFSILPGLLILAVTMSGEAAILLKLRSHPLTRRRVVRDALMLAIAILLWFAWSELIDRLSMHDVLRAGYLNSRFPHAYRNFFSYPHFLLWFSWLWAALRWLGIGLLLALAIAAVQSTDTLRAGLRAFFSASYRVVLIGVALITDFVTNLLLSWTPGHGVAAEMVSVALRLAVIGLVDLVLGCYLLTTASAVIERYSIPAGKPETSQPRTVENP